MTEEIDIKILKINWKKYLHSANGDEEVAFDIFIKNYKDINEETMYKIMGEYDIAQQCVENYFSD